MRTPPTRHSPGERSSAERSCCRRDRMVDGGSAGALMIGQETLLKNFVGGRWETASAQEAIAVRNPATGDVLAEAPLSSAADVTKAVQAASNALQAWRRTPAGD